MPLLTESPILSPRLILINHYFLPSILEGLKAKTVPTLGSSKYVLIELPFEIIPPFARGLVFEIQLLGLRPILAHPERNLRIQRNPDHLKPFIESGCLTQLNSTSITGHLGKNSQDSSFELLTRGWASIIASGAIKPESEDLILSTPSISPQNMWEGKRLKIWCGKDHGKY